MCEEALDVVIVPVRNMNGSQNKEKNDAVAES